MPALSAPAFPVLAWWITRTPGSPIASTMSGVPSVEPSSTTITSSGWSLAVSARTVSSMHSRSL